MQGLVRLNGIYDHFRKIRRYAELSLIRCRKNSIRRQKKAAQELGLIPLAFCRIKRVEHWKAVIWGWLQQMKSCHFKEKIDTIAAQMKKSLDLEGILALAETAVPLKENEDIREAEEKEKEPVTALDKPESTGLQDTAGNKLRIAVAKDAAFCFLYEDNLEYLRANGCELVFF